MMGLSTGGGSSDIQGLYSLLALLSDPTKIKARLEELAAKMAAAAAASDQANAQIKKSEVASKAASDAQAAADATLARYRAESAAKDNSLLNRENVVKQRESAVAAQVAKLEKDRATHEDSVVAHASYVSRVTKELDARKDEIEKYLNKTEADLRADWSAKLDTAAQKLSEAEQHLNVAAVARKEAEALRADFTARLKKLQSLATD